MQKDAEIHAAEDKRKRELADARNEADQHCFQLEKMLQEHRDKLSEADQMPLKQAIEKVRQLAKGDDAQAIRSALQDLEQTAQAVGKVLYQQTQGCGSGAELRRAGSCQPGSQSRTNSTEDDAIDAEFEVKA